MVRHRMLWEDECALSYEQFAQIGADNSVIFDHEPVFVLLPDELFGQIEQVDYFKGENFGLIVGQMAEEERDFCAVDVISIMRGPVVIAVRAVQRAFRRKRYLKWYKEVGWDMFVKDVVAWINLECRYFRKREHDPFGESVMPTWGYVPAPAVAASCDVIVPALGRHPRTRTFTVWVMART